MIMNKQRLPAYPLFVHDPYFSIWSNSDELTNSNTIFWTGQLSPVYGVIRANNQSYCFLGKIPCIKKLEQKHLSLTSFSTNYIFENDLFELHIKFISPLLPNDLDILACPVCYFNYEIIPKQPLKDVSISLFINEQICYDEKVEIRGGVMKMRQYETSWFGRKKQSPLSHIGDAIKAEWGYYYLTGMEAYYLSSNAVNKYYQTGEIDYELNDNEEKYLLSVNRYNNINEAVTGIILVAFDDCCSINYFGDWLKGYFFRDGKNIIDAINYSYDNYLEIYNKINDYDYRLQNDAKKYGEDYLLILYASLRQSLAAHKLVVDNQNNILFLSKECLSNGCIATVDVSYPSSPLYLLYNPELLKGMLRPIFKFAKLPVWPYDFAPHDAGTYPYCCGQTYGLNNEKTRYLDDSFNICWDKKETLPLIYLFPEGSNLYNLDRQMPIEECSNMLIMTLSVLILDNDIKFIKENYKLLKKWADYLVNSGIFINNQLCTDDFTGKLDANVNLAIKSILGIYSFSVICKKLGKEKLFNYYYKIAKKYSKIITDKYQNESHLPLSFYQPNTFSLKYNLAFSIVFNTDLFDKQLIQNEINYYLNNMNEYGVPLDSRNTYTKSDWMSWIAILSDNEQIRMKFISPVAKFLRETKDRVPFSDWYDTKSCKKVGFQNRSVQGGVFILLLDDSNKLKTQF